VDAAIAGARICSYFRAPQAVHLRVADATTFVDVRWIPIEASSKLTSGSPSKVSSFLNARPRQRATRAAVCTKVKMRHLAMSPAPNNHSFDIVLYNLTKVNSNRP
jgi:hypothetical protein